MQMQGPIMQRRAFQWCHGRDTLARLQQLQDAEESARYSLWRWVITNEAGPLCQQLIACFLVACRSDPRDDRAGHVDTVPGVVSEDKGKVDTGRA